MRNALRVSPSRKAREAGSGSGEAYPVPPTQAQVGHISFVVDETSFNTMADTKNHVYAVAEAENRRVVSSGRLVRVAGGADDDGSESGGDGGPQI